MKSMGPITFRLLFDQLTSHQLWDIIYYLPFLCGQALFLLKRVGLAIRSPLNCLKSRREYLYINWDILVYRAGLEFILIYFPYRHQDVVSGWLASFGWHLPFQLPQAAILFVMLGLMSDYMLDWIAGHDKVFGMTIPKFLKEQIPQIPEVQGVLKAMAEQKNGTP